MYRSFSKIIFSNRRIVTGVESSSKYTKRTRNFTSVSSCPTHADVVIIGGAGMGSSIAYFLKHKTKTSGLKVVVIEKDLSYSKCSTVLSAGGVRQQFSLPENIQMSMFAAEFLQSLKERFGPDADASFVPNGYLMFATENGAQQLLDNAKIQKQLGAVNIVLSKESLIKRFPWLNVTDVEVGCLGLEKEGWFDPWGLLNTLKRSAINLGAEYIQGEAIGFSVKSREGLIGLDEVQIKTSRGDTKTIRCNYCVIATGAESGKVGKLIEMGSGPEMLAVPLPVERRKRYIYCFNCQGDAPTMDTPLTIDYTGVYFRPEGSGGLFIGGLSPTPVDEPDTSNLDVDYQYFDNKVWPLLAHRVPAFNSIKVRSAWAGYYDVNLFDKNGIIGPHPNCLNLYFATGFSGHGIQQVPAVGRAIAEHIVDGGFKTIDLSRLGYGRLLNNKPMYEVCIV